MYHGTIVLLTLYPFSKYTIHSVSTLNVLQIEKDKIVHFLHKYIIVAFILLQAYKLLMDVIYSINKRDLQFLLLFRYFTNCIYFVHCKVNVFLDPPWPYKVL